MPEQASTSLMDVLPEIAALLPEADSELAARVLRVPMLHADGVLLEEVMSGTPAFDFIVSDGVVLKETNLAGRISVELLGPGDVLGPPLAADHQAESRATSVYRAHGEVTLAAIEEHFRAAARRWPQLSDVLHDRLARQTHRASMHLAVLHIPRADYRTLALFSDLAERFGRVTSDGIEIDIALSHELIGRLIGSQRPTVSLALEELSRAGVLTRTSEGSWMLNAPGVLV